MKRLLNLQAMAAAASFLLVACGDDKPAGECRVDTDCVSAAVLTCQVAKCNTTTSTCEAAPAPDATPCATGNACLLDETCNAGVCAGGTVKPADCGARECGSDSCGNNCGDCLDSEECNSNGICEADPLDCGTIAYEGCCTAAGQAKYCNEGVLETLDCPTNTNGGTVCGWPTDEGYDCTTQATSDTSGTFPYLCPGESCGENACGSRECGFVCGQACGTGCTGDEVCNADGACIENPCGDVTFFGCCNADGTVTYCDTASYELITIDCKAEVGPDATCGWEDAESGYWCVGAQTADPTSTYPFLCGGETCTETCDDRACGSVCGQTCANTCEGGLVCEESTGTCITNPCGNLGVEGCCDGTSVFFCEDFKVVSADCVTVAEELGDPSINKCGWGENEDGPAYLCTDNEGADPATTFARPCSSYTFTLPEAPAVP